MKAEIVLEAMGHLDGGLIEEADDSAVRSGMRGAVRTLLIAACLCAVSIGTALGVTRIAGFDSLEFFKGFQHQGASYHGYSLAGGVDFVPLEELSDEVMELSGENPAVTVRLPVADRSEAERLTGLELPEELSGQTLKLHSFAANLTSDAQGPTVLSFEEEYRDDDRWTLRLSVYSVIYTEHMEDTKEPVTVSYAFPSGQEYATEEYRTDAGLTVLLTECERPENDVFYGFYGAVTYYADFALNGIRYHLVACCPEDPEAALEVLKAVLEQF